MISAIVLAAGASTRMGRQKLLLPFGQSTVIRHLVGQVLASRADETLVVTGYDHQSVADQVSDLPIRVLRNPAPEHGMLSSVRHGVRAVRKECTGIMIFLGDQPNIETRAMDAVIEHFCGSDGGIVIPTFEGKRGHPMVLSTNYSDEILTEYDGVGLRGLRLAHEGEVRYLPLGQSEIVEDMDTPEDYARLRRRLDE